LGGDSFKVSLEACKPTVAEAKAEIARSQGTQRELLKSTRSYIEWLSERMVWRFGRMMRNQSLWRMIAWCWEMVRL
jgi:hypothetical protein